jgi:polysaccharide export outer membrane protein
MRPLGLLLLALAIGCEYRTKPHPDVAEVLVKEGQAPLERQLDVTVETVETAPPEEPGPYRIGPNDRLHVSVLGHPEFSGAGQRGEGQLIGYRVQRDGKVYLPMIDGLDVAGLSIPEVRKKLRTALEKYIKDPGVIVEVLSFESQRFYVLGEVEEPGVFPVDGNKTLLDGIALAKGIRDTGDIENSFVIRGSKLLPVSLGDIMLRGDTSRNVFLQHGDMIYVPDKSKWRVYVLGEVVQPGIVPMTRRGLTLADAIAAVGGLDPVSANRKKIRIFRGSWARPKAYTLSREDVLMYGASIQLRPGDRVFVAETGLAAYSRFMTQLTPFIQTGATAAVFAASLK